MAEGGFPRAWKASPAFMSSSAHTSKSPPEVVTGIETDRGLFVGALIAAGYLVYAVNPMSTSRYRDRHSSSGAKSDPGDAKVLADMVRTDRHNHRPVSGDSETAEAVKVLAQAHQSMIWSRGLRPMRCARRFGSSTPPHSSPSRTSQVAMRHKS